MSVAAEVLWDYVLGHLSTDEKAELDAELQRSPALRAEIAELAELATALPLALPAATPPPAIKQRLLASIVAPRPFDVWLEKLERLFDLPAAGARALLDLAYDAAAWKPSGMAGCDLIHVEAGPATAGADVGFVRVAPGFRFPHHRHNGDEITVVLQGAYRDSYTGAVVRPGDVAVLPAGSEHEYVVEPGEDCIYATVVHEGLEVTATEGPGAGWTVDGSKSG